MADASEEPFLEAMRALTRDLHAQLEAAALRGEAIAAGLDARAKHVPVTHAESDLDTAALRLLVQLTRMTIEVHKP